MNEGRYETKETNGHIDSLYTGSWDYTVKLWDPRDHKLARVFHQLDRVCIHIHLTFNYSNLA